jgi:SRSO17 transposase
MPIPAWDDTIFGAPCQALSDDRHLRSGEGVRLARLVERGEGVATRWPDFRLTGADLSGHAQELVDFHQRFSGYFRTTTRDGAPHALEYLKGQLLCESRRTMSRMAVAVTEMNEQALSHFIATSPWDDAPLLEALGREAVTLLTSAPEAGERALILDESGMPKQGPASVGVARQYCGVLGKVENCQVGVFLAYSTGVGVTLSDRRLYLPEEWVHDPARCEKAGIPQEARVFRTKAELGVEMIRQARQRGMPFDFVGMDAHYGQQPWLLTCLEAEGLVYVADIPADTRVYLDAPVVGVPPRQGPRGRWPTTCRVLHGEAVEVRQLVLSLAWQPLKVRDTQRGELWIRFAAVRVWRIEEGLPCPQPVWLLVRQDLDGDNTKFSFSNAPLGTPVPTLAARQSRRYWVERALEDAKGLAGLDEYQVIGWRGWHHHMTMVLLAMLFLRHLQQTLQPKAPLLTLQDARALLAVVLPKRQLTYAEAVALIRNKHLNRLRSRNSRVRKQNIQLKATGFLM